MFELIVFLFSSKLIRPKWLFKTLLNLLDKFNRLKGKTLQFDVSRFEKAAWVSGGRMKAGSMDKTIELVVVSTAKDFDILYHSVNFAIKAISDYKSGGVRIIVPTRDIEQCKLLFKSMPEKVTVIDEASIVSRAQFKLLTESFGVRDTWVLQQLLKVQAVVNSNSDAVLILDSDTILLRKRPWFDAFGRQILMPSAEFNPPYYEFLNRMIASPSIPEFTFISHHMIMQPFIFRKILADIGLDDIDKLIEYCEKNSDRSVQSPLCIEYELYGQSLFYGNSDLFFISQWANATIPKRYSSKILHSRIIKFFLTKSFNSVSFHSWS